VFNYHQQEIFSIVRNEYTDWDRPIFHPIPLRDATVEALSDCVAIGPVLQVGMIHAKRGAKTFVMHFSHVSKDQEFPGYEVRHLRGGVGCSCFMSVICRDWEVSRVTRCLTSWDSQ
jgi:hypothetical protein